MKRLARFIKTALSLIARLLGLSKGEGYGPGWEPKIDKTYGGFDFRRAKEDPGAQIDGLEIRGDRMSYSWKPGCGLSGWGLPKTKADALAVLAVRRRGQSKYSGGKFDWISQSRRTRDFKNILSGYEGWPKDSIASSDEFAFCIVSKDGRRRTNWIRFSK